MKPPKKLKPGGLFPNNKPAFVDSVLTANKGLDWVKRLREANTPKVLLPGEDRPSTHLMGDDGNGYVFHTLVRKPGQKKLTNLGNQAEDYARETNTGIQFPKKKGDWFAGNNNGNGSYGGYKQGTGVLAEFKMGTKKLKKAANGLQNILGGAIGGASSGAALGPWGALAGGVLGAGASYFQGRDEEEMLKKLKQQQLVQTTQAQVGMDNSPMSQMSQYKQGGKTMKHKAIEIEGGEPHFSKKIGGKRTLKQYSPNGPTHEQGGIPVLAEAGDAIVTAKGAKGALAVAAHQAGDHATVEKLINQMPEDKGSAKKPRGTRSLASIKFKPGKTVLPQELLSTVSPSDSDATRMAAVGMTLRPGLVSGTAGTSAVPVAAASSSVGKGVSPLNSLAQAAPTLYNLGQGIFGNVDKTTRRTYNPALNTYADLSGPSRQASVQAQNLQVANARNLSGGSVGNVRANANAAFAENATRQGAINSQEAGRKLDIANQNTSIRNDAQLRNNAMNDQADAYDMQNATKKQEALAKGLEGISGLAANSQLMGNQQSRDMQNRKQLGDMFANYKVDELGNIVPRKRKGAKSIKVKK